MDGSGATFRRDPWARGDAAYGATACLEGGSLLEKAAASVSVVTGTLSPGRAAAMAARGSPPLPAGTPYAAAALSIVFHPASPHVPTLRGDVRLFYAGGGEGAAVATFGGGADLTPAYLYPPDAAAFHAHWKAVCDGHAAGLYEELKVCGKRERERGSEGERCMRAEGASPHSPTSHLFSLPLKTSPVPFFRLTPSPSLPLPSPRATPISTCPPAGSTVAWAASFMTTSARSRRV